MTAAWLRDFMPYGAPDLQDAEPRHLVRALMLGSLLASLMFAAAWSLSLVFTMPSIPVAISVERHDMSDMRVLQPPPAVAPIAPAIPIAKPPSVAIPVPVPDAVAPREETVASQSELSSILGEGSRSEARIPVAAPPIEGPINQEGETPMVDELPVPVRAVEPPYPDLARQAHVEGLVVVNVLVGKDGRVMEAKLHPIVNIVLLNDATLEAARKWVFTPAIDHGRPVAVWVSLPFHYRLY